MLNISECPTLEKALPFIELSRSAVNLMYKAEAQAAIPLLHKALALNPNHASTHGNLGVAYGCLAQKELAIAHLNKALILDPNYQLARDNLNKIETGAKVRILNRNTF